MRMIPFLPSDLMIAVAAAPTPPPPDIVTTGATVYPAPELVITISSMEVTLFLVVNIPTAVASVPPLGAVVSPIVGTLVNPEPSFSKLILLTNPVPIVAVAVAADQTLFIVRSVITPKSSVLLSIASIPVSIVSSLYSNSSHCNS